jgi:hypothetical protein
MGKKWVKPKTVQKRPGMSCLVFFFVDFFMLRDDLEEVIYLP